MELILVRRILPVVEGGLPEYQYAYQRLRSTEITPSDLDRFASTDRARGNFVYVVGLDVAGAFDSASLTKLTETLRYNRAPELLTRFIGTWLTNRVFRVRLATPVGTAFSEYHYPSMGGPAGGVAIAASLATSCQWSVKNHKAEND